MEKKRPFMLIAMIMATFAAIAMLNPDMTGFSVYGKLSSIFSGNTLSTIAPTAILMTILSVSMFALSRISRD